MNIPPSLPLKKHSSDLTSLPERTRSSIRYTITRIKECLPAETVSVFFETMEEFQLFRRAVYSEFNDISNKCSFYSGQQEVRSVLGVDIEVRKIITFFMTPDATLQPKLKNRIGRNSSLGLPLKSVKSPSGIKAELDNLAYCAFFAHIEGCEVILKRDPEQISKSFTKSGRSALDHAIRTGRLPLVEKFWGLGCRAGLKTPIIDAIVFGYSDIALFLFKVLSKEQIEECMAEVKVYSVVLCGSEELLKTAFEHGMKLKSTDDISLPFTLEFGHWRMAEILIDQEANFSDPEKILEKACNNDDLEGVRLLALKRKSALPKGKIYEQAVFKSVQKGDIKTLEALWDKSLNCEMRNEQGLGLLHIAIRHGHLDMYDLLVSKGCDLHQKDAMQRSTLHHACEKGNLKAAEYLISKGIEVDGLDNIRNTPLFFALDSRNRELIQLLKSKSASLIHQRIDGQDPVSYALRYVDRSTAYYVASLGGCIDLVHNGELQTLNAAIEKEDVEAIERLFYAITNHKLYEKQFWKSLVIVCQAGRFDLAKEFIQAGIGFKITWGNRSPTLAVIESSRSEEDKIEMLEILYDATINNSHLFLRALSRNELKVADALIRLEGDFKSHGDSAWVTNAVLHNQLQLVQKLKMLGAPIDEKNKSTIVVAIIYGHVDVAMYLIDAGADINGEYNGTCIQFAIMKHNYPIYLRLMEKGAVLSDFRGIALIILASQSSLAEVNASKLRLTGLASFLIEHTKDALSRHQIFMDLISRGHDINHRDKNGRTPLDWYLITCRPLDWIRTLISCGADASKLDVETIMSFIFTRNSFEHYNFLMNELKVKYTFSQDQLYSAFSQTVKFNNLKMMKEVFNLGLNYTQYIRNKSFSIPELYSIETLYSIREIFGDNGITLLANVGKRIKHSFALKKKTVNLGSFEFELEGGKTYAIGLLKHLDYSFEQYVELYFPEFAKVYPKFLKEDIKSCYQLCDAPDLSSIKNSLSKGLPVVNNTGFKSHTIGMVWFVIPNTTKAFCIISNRGSGTKYIGQSIISGSSTLEHLTCLINNLIGNELKLDAMGKSLEINDINDLLKMIKESGFNVEDFTPLLEQYPQQDGTCHHDNNKGSVWGLFYALGILSGYQETVAAAHALRFYKMFTTFERNSALQWTLAAIDPKIYPREAHFDKELFMELYMKVKDDPRIHKPFVKTLESHYWELENR